MDRNVCCHENFHICLCQEFERSFSRLRCSWVTSDDVGWDWEHPISPGRIWHPIHWEEHRPIIQGKYNLLVTMLEFNQKNAFNTVNIDDLSGKRSQNQGDERGWVWRWQMKLPPKTVQRKRRRYEKSQRISRGKRDLTHYQWHGFINVVGG